MTDFESKVLEALGDIKADIATNAQAHKDQERRVNELVEYNRVQDSRAWVKSIVVGAAVIIGHPLARKLGLDI